MLYRPLGKTGYDVSGVVYGGVISTDVPQADSDRYVAWSIERGINYFDIAPSYGNAEEQLGRSLKPYRKNVYVACKTLERTREGVLKELTRSLALMHTDWFDLYQLHAMTTPEDVETAFGPGGAMEVLLELKQQGVIRKLGFSAHSEYAALKCLELYDFDTVLFPTSYQLHMHEGIGRALKAEKARKGFGLLGMKSLIDRAWKNDNERKASGYLKSWCKPFCADEGALRLAGMKYAVQHLGADVLLPPGNFECYRFMAEHVKQAFSDPIFADEQVALKARYQEGKTWPFFLKNNGNWEVA